VREGQNYSATSPFESFLLDAHQTASKARVSRDTRQVIRDGKRIAFGAHESHVALGNSSACGALAQQNNLMHVHVPFFRRVLPVYLAFVVTLSSPSLLFAQAVDTTPPTVSVTTPPGGAVVAGTVTVSAAAYDNGSVVGLLFQINGSQLGPELTSGGCIGGLTAAADWNTTSAPDGNYTIVATARDAGGNATSSTPITVTVMNTPPPAGSPAPSPGSTPSTPVPEIPNPPSLPSVPDQPPPVFPGGCTTPDPFVAFGGGTCVNGGWMPPGIVGGTVPPAPPLPSGPVAYGGCVTPDPFVAFGGGTCFNGGWYPPGITAAPALPTPSPDIPAPTYGGCSTPDPFVVFGGGRCVNGGWLPPGIITPAPAPVPQGGFDNPLPPIGAGCLTPDPFANIPGLAGECVNGGWRPVARLTVR
jgi:hypothetical protein